MPTGELTFNSFSLSEELSNVTVTGTYYVGTGTTNIGLEITAEFDDGSNTGTKTTIYRADNAMWESNTPQSLILGAPFGPYSATDVYTIVDYSIVDETGTIIYSGSSGGSTPQYASTTLEIQDNASLLGLYTITISNSDPNSEHIHNYNNNNSSTTTDEIAQGLVDLINGYSDTTWTATASGDTITITSTVDGEELNVTSSSNITITNSGSSGGSGTDDPITVTTVCDVDITSESGPIYSTATGIITNTYLFEDATAFDLVGGFPGPYEAARAILEQTLEEILRVPWEELTDPSYLDCLTDIGYSLNDNSLEASIFRNQSAHISAISSATSIAGSLASAASACNRFEPGAAATVAGLASALLAQVQIVRKYNSCMLSTVCGIAKRSKIFRDIQNKKMINNMLDGGPRSNSNFTDMIADIDSSNNIVMKATSGVSETYFERDTHLNQTYCTARDTHDEIALKQANQILDYNKVLYSINNTSSITARNFYNEPIEEYLETSSTTDFQIKDDIIIPDLFSSNTVNFLETDRYVYIKPEYKEKYITINNILIDNDIIGSNNILDLQNLYSKDIYSKYNILIQELNEEETERSKNLYSIFCRSEDTATKLEFKTSKVMSSSKEITKDIKNNNGIITKNYNLYKPTESILFSFIEDKEDLSSAKQEQFIIEDGVDVYYISNNKIYKRNI